MIKQFSFRPCIWCAGMLAQLIALPIMAIEISGYTSGAGHYIIEAAYRPAIEPLAGLSIRMKLDPAVNISVVATDAPSTGAWSQIKPELFRSSTTLSLSALAPTIMASSDIGLMPLFSVSIETVDSLVSLTRFSQLVDSVIIDKALTPDGSAATAQIVLMNTITAVRGKPGVAQQNMDFKYRAIGQRHSLSFNIAHTSRVRARIADAQGRMVHTLDDRIMQAGIHTLSWDGKTVNGRFAAGGIYFLNLEAGHSTFSKKIILAR